MLEIIDSNYTRNRYGVTHFAELHRTLHKNFLIWRCQIWNPFSALSPLRNIFTSSGIPSSPALHLPSLPLPPQAPSGHRTAASPRPSSIP